MAAIQHPQPHNERLEAALAYAARGWHVFPLQPDSKIPFGNTRGVSEATTDLAQIRRWWARWPRANVAVAGGNGLIILDEDTYKGADASGFLLPVTLTARSARGGLHRYFFYDGELGNVAEGKLAAHISFRAKGYYVVAPPSTAYGGKLYTWLDPDQPVAQLPERIARMIRGDDREKPQPVAPVTMQGRPNLRESSGEHWVDQAVERARSQGRNNAGLWLAQQLLWNECADPDGAMRYYAGVVEDWETPRYTEREALASLTQARKHPKREPARSQTAKPTQPTPIRPAVANEPRKITHPVTDGANALATSMPPTDDEKTERFALTEMGNAERLYATYGRDIRYCKAFGFCIWDGSRWQPDAELAVRKWSKETVRAMYAEAAELAQLASGAENSEKSKQFAGDSVELMKWARKSETAHMIDAMLNLIRDTCQVEPSVFDAKPMLFNVRNGTVDLATGQLLPHRRDDYLMQMSPATYDAKAKAPTFERFVRQIMCERESLVTYLQRALGYCLSGDVKEQVWHLLVGEGENGKSTLIEAICAVMGEYADMLEPESIIMGGKATDPNAPSPAIASLKGKRLVKVSETEEGARIAPARIKRLSGADELSGRHLNKGIFKFMPTFKLFIYTNHRPQVRETTHAFWRRVRYIPFDFNLGKLPPEAKDLDLPKKLAAEASGILAWLVRGCLAWQRDGLKPPKEVMEATEAYKRDSDLLKMFLDENVLDAPQASTSARAVYGRYTVWCEDYGERPMSQRRLGETLAERGFQRAHTRSGWVWMGIQLAERE